MSTLQNDLALRFGDTDDLDLSALEGNDFAGRLAARRSHRAFKPDPVDPGLVRSLCALALCAPSKSDLQQRDIVVVEDPTQRRKLKELIPGNAWIDGAPAFLVFCANNRRQRNFHTWRERPFPNDHLDAFFNACVDAGIALATFMNAAEAIGLGCCPVSAIRNKAAGVSELLALPDHVFPVAGLGLGWPSEEGAISLRLPLAATVHTDRFDDASQREEIESYDRRRAAHQPFAHQKFTEQFGEIDDYGWSEDKARQYSVEERAGFGQFIRAKGFDLS